MKLSYVIRNNLLVYYGIRKEKRSRERVIYTASGKTARAWSDKAYFLTSFGFFTAALLVSRNCILLSAVRRSSNRLCSLVYVLFLWVSVFMLSRFDGVMLGDKRPRSSREINAGIRSQAIVDRRGTWPINLQSYDQSMPWIKAPIRFVLGCREAYFE